MTQFKPSHSITWPVLVASLSLAAVFTGCSKEKTSRPSDALTQIKEEYAIGRAVPGQLLVQTDQISAVEKLRKDFDVLSIDAQLGIYALQGQKLNGRETEIISELNQTGDFAIVEPSYIRTTGSAAHAAFSMPKDKKWLELWALKNYGQDAPKGMEGVAGADISAVEAWKVSTGTPEGVKRVRVAIVDTGVDYTHPDLKENIWKNEAEINGVPGVDDDKNGYTDDKYGWNFVSSANDSLSHGQLGTPDSIDDHGHGTHVAGTIGAMANNGIGVTGIIWNPEIMAAKFLSSSGSGNSLDEIRAIRYAVDNHAEIINASYGGGPASKITEAVIRDAGKRGVLFVAAAGNESSNNDETDSFPANYPLDNVLSVAATDNRDQLAEFSNYGYAKVHLAAPGVGITSTYPLKINQEEGGAQPYRTFSGTSMATPHVVGAAALLVAARPELRGKPAEIKRVLMESADWLPQLAGSVVSGGRLNLARAVKNESGGTPLAQKQWVEEPYALATPRYPTERINQAWKIQKTGAQALRAHVKSSIIDEPFDLGIIYDTFFRPISKVPGFAQDYWTPAVFGDSLYIKFSNAMVIVRKVVEIKNVEDPDSLDSDSPSTCIQNPGAETYTCKTYEKAGQPIANFNSEGIEIDRISYLPAQ